MGRKSAPVNPGDSLVAEFLEPLPISQHLFAREISVPSRRIQEMVHGTRAVTADTALRLGRYFGISAPFWL